MDNRVVSHPVRLEYRILFLGQAEFRITAGDFSAIATASYVSDALGDFARAVVAIIDGQRSSRVLFIEEPGEFEWKLNRRGDLLHCILSWDPEPVPDRMVERWERKLDVMVSWSEFVCAVKSMLANVLLSYGFDGYWEQWHQCGFPLSAQARIIEYTEMIGQEMDRGNRN